jgi:hypothetical protein
MQIGFHEAVAPVTALALDPMAQQCQRELIGGCAIITGARIQIAICWHGPRRMNLLAIQLAAEHIIAAPTLLDNHQHFESF